MKAIDVVLLPEKAISEKAIEINRQLVENFGRKIFLDTESSVPHISLAMGCLDEANRKAVEEKLRVTGQQTTLGKLSIEGISVSENAAGEMVSVLEIRKTERLQRLHERIMEGMKPYLSFDVKPEMIAGSEKVAESTLAWIKNYRAKSSFADFRPHITLGYGQTKKQTGPVEFNAEKLALCHLGNHCTCRKVLWATEI